MIELIKAREIECGVAPHFDLFMITNLPEKVEEGVLELHVQVERLQGKHNPPDHLCQP
jgi:hypothetical protein